MIEGVVLGIVQGVAEWIPVSSEGMLVLAQVYLFEGQTLREMVELALFLHLGTLFAAILYFWDEVVRIFKTLSSYRRADKKDRELTLFLVWTTVVTAFVGTLFFAATEETVPANFAATGQFTMALVGILLLITASLYFWGSRKRGGIRKTGDANTKDMVVTGAAQGLAVLPGLSRSGLTIAALLLRGFSEEETLRLSFLMSIPVVLVGNVALNLFSGFSVTETAMVGLSVSFIVGVLTIHALFTIARRVNFGYFAAIFGFLSILAAFI